MPKAMLIIEDEELLGEELKSHFRSSGWDVALARTLAEAREHLLSRNLQPDVVVSDMSLPDGNSLNLLEEVREAVQLGEWIFLTGYGTVPDSVRALRLGAHDFLEKPCPMDRLDLVVAGAMRSSRAQRRLQEAAKRETRRYGPEAFLGSSDASQKIRKMLRRLARVPLNALVIGGETGTGKGLVARILHYSGVRSSGPLVEINCATLPRDLLESELFGHEAGAFTGARGRHRGLFEQAQSGTLFLDEVSEMDQGLQAKLLRAVEERHIRRLGGEKEVEVDVQIFAASNRDLSRLVRDGDFRQDLYHRLSVFSLEMPPLRTRMADLEDLVPAFVAESNTLSGKQVTEISAEVWDRLRAYSWPGNVRELRNVIERSVLLATSDSLPARWLQLPDEDSALPVPSAKPTRGGGGTEGTSRADVLHLPLDGSVSLDEMEATIIREVLERNGFNVTAAARELGTTRQTLRYRIEKHRIDEGRATLERGSS
ncbi:sigma-54-dependent transcriptional regulator [Gemmatimonadota bacterium]